MELFLNEAKAEVVKRYFDYYPLDGITTNPKMIGSLGKVPYDESLRGLRAVIGEKKKFFTQVTSPNYEDMLKEAEYITSIIGKEYTYVKLPASEEGIKAIRTLHDHGYHTCATLCFTAIQSVMALQAGADWVAVFYNYMLENGINPTKTLSDIAAYVKESGCSGKLMGVGVRAYDQLSDCFSCGCQGVNLNASNITEWVLNEPAIKTSKNFMDGWEATWGDTKIIDFIK